MTEEKLKNIGEVGEIVKAEGLEYSIMDYLSPHKIEDVVLRDLWKKAREAFENVDKYLGDILGENYKYE